MREKRGTACPAPAYEPNLWRSVLPSMRNRWMKIVIWVVLVSMLVTTVVMGINIVVNI